MKQTQNTYAVSLPQYFENKILRKRSYLQKEWCIGVINNPLKVQEQENGRVRFWGTVAGIDGKILRVITLSDRMTIHNAFLIEDINNETQLLRRYRFFIYRFVVN